MNTTTINKYLEEVKEKTVWSVLRGEYTVFVRYPGTLQLEEIFLELRNYFFQKWYMLNVFHSIKITKLCRNYRIDILLTLPEMQFRQEFRKHLLAIETAEKIVSRLKPYAKDAFELELLLHDELSKRAAYDFEASIMHRNDAYTIYGVLIKHRAVCQGFALAFKMYCQLAGLECKTVFGHLKEDGVLSPHAWNLVKICDEWYHVDLTLNNSININGNGKIHYGYFNINDRTMSLTHEWDRGRHPTATGRKYNYHTKRGVLFSDSKKARKFLNQRLNCSDQYITLRCPEIKNIVNQLWWNLGLLFNQYQYVLDERISAVNFYKT